MTVLTISPGPPGPGQMRNGPADRDKKEALRILQKSDWFVLCAGGEGKQSAVWRSYKQGNRRSVPAAIRALFDFARDEAEGEAIEKQRKTLTLANPGLSFELYLPDNEVS